MTPHPPPPALLAKKTKNTYSYVHTPTYILSNIFAIIRVSDNLYTLLAVFGLDIIGKTKKTVHMYIHKSVRTNVFTITYIYALMTYIPWLSYLSLMIWVWKKKKEIVHIYVHL